MGYEERKFFTAPNRLAEGFLISDFIYDPDVPKEKELNAEHVAEADLALRCWRGDFYRYNRRRYVKVSDREMRLLTTRHLNDSLCYSPDADDQYITITSQLVSNILLCTASTACVHINEQRGRCLCSPLSPLPTLESANCNN